jgi:diacylglycerol kinase (ATP)
MLRHVRQRIRQGRRFVRAVPQRTLVQSFNYAFEGLIYVLATQRNMRIHFVAASAALVAAVMVGVERWEFIAIVFAAAFVIVAEMMNTAIESAIDVATSTFNPLAKIAKDVAAGAVLIATFNALAIAYLVFGQRIDGGSPRILVQLRDVDVHITFVALVLTFLAVIALKVVSGRAGTPMRGGFPSGHAAIAFATWMSITLVTIDTTYGTLISALTLFLAVLVAQTRVESGIHSTLEVVVGAIVGAIITLMIFQVVHFTRPGHHWIW